MAGGGDTDGHQGPQGPGGGGHGSDEARLLEVISGQLAGLQASFDKGLEILGEYRPALDKAAALVNSPAAKLARGWRTMHGG